MFKRQINIYIVNMAIKKSYFVHICCLQQLYDKIFFFIIIFIIKKGDNEKIIFVFHDEYYRFVVLFSNVDIHPVKGTVHCMATLQTLNMSSTWMILVKIMIKLCQIYSHSTYVVPLNIYTQFFWVSLSFNFTGKEWT